MKKILFYLLIVSSVCIPWTAMAGKAVKIEVLYMNHGPLQDSLEQIRNVFSKYKEKVTVSWYDFDSKEGERFMAQKKITQHIPLLIWMDDQVKFKVDGKDIVFAGFPTGSGPAFFQGKWTMADLQKTLEQLTGKK
ncbi:MAG: hypothetical protein A2Z51_08025 [Deltaproteobacteria bacterium RBG_19FT_COMBO_52_11]|jgi:uncharacterized protein YbaA (DUF1428 family)|nr:MAG: hypothetical protein A2Z51_08025 [Deltaproteobacteria bacterium RBG_19FT_COMBO_52_11]